MTHEPTKTSPGWTLAIVSIALFMVTLDNLVVTTALPSIRADLGATLSELEWTVNAYTLAFTVFLLPGAALGDRFGRRRMFLVGLTVFTTASALAALAPGTTELVAARALQGVGAGLVAPLTLTLLSEAFPGDKRGAAIGIWSGVSGLGVALGPLVGGAVVEGISWQWIFWINVPVGLILIPLAVRMLGESRGIARALDLPGVALAAAGLLTLTYGIVEGNADGWGSAATTGRIAAGVLILAAFVAYEARAKAPMLPMHFFKSRGFTTTNAVSFAMFFGIFGSIFLLAQLFQAVQGMSPLDAGLKTLPWTGMPMLVAPIAGLLSDRIGSRPLMAAGLTLQAIAITWIAAVQEVATPYGEIVIPLILGGAGMGLVFAPAANAVLRSVEPHETGQASGATNAIRELGGVLGIAVLAAVFAHNGGYASPQDFLDGLRPALHIGAVVLVAGAVAALFVPGLKEQPEAREVHAEPVSA